MFLYDDDCSKIIYSNTPLCVLNGSGNTTNAGLSSRMYMSVDFGCEAGDTFKNKTIAHTMIQHMYFS